MIDWNNLSNVKKIEFYFFNITMLGFKGTNRDLTCIHHQFKINEIYTTDTLGLCCSGYHFTEHLRHVNDYYSFNSDNRFFIICADGEVISDKIKSVTNKIKLLEEISLENIDNIMKNYSQLLQDNFDGIFVIVCVKHDYAIGVRALFDRVKTYIENNFIENANSLYLKTITANNNYAFKWAYDKKHKDIVKIINDEYKQLYASKTINSREYLNLIRTEKTHLVNYVCILLGLSN